MKEMSSGLLLNLQLQVAAVTNLQFRNNCKFRFHQPAVG
jgi:hypothetical protein